MTDKTRNPGAGCISIPPEALEAGAKEMYLRANPDLKWEDCAIECGQDVRQAYLYRARAAFVAMVEAWPNGGLHVPVGAGEPRKSFTLPALILPLAAPSGAITEKQDDKA